MLTKEQEEDLKFLREQKNVIIPPRFTFWLHHTAYNNPKYMRKRERSWTEIPTNDFVVKGEMSFVRGVDWIKSMVLRKLKEPPYIYQCPKGALPFRIIVIQPRHNTLAEMYTGEEYKKRVYEENGLGDCRHEKIAGNTHLYIFACKNKGKKMSEVDTLYAIREQDLSEYVKDIKKTSELSVNTGDVWARMGFNINEEKSYVEENHSTKVLDKSANFHRFKDAIISPETGGFVMLAPYKKEVIDNHNAMEEKVDDEVTELKI